MNRKDLGRFIKHHAEWLTVAYFDAAEPNSQQIDGTLLNTFYWGIYQDVGPEGAKEFVRMVADIRILTPQDFVAKLYFLEENGWKYPADFVVAAKDSLDPATAAKVVHEIMHRQKAPHQPIVCFNTLLDTQMSFLKKHLTKEEFFRKFPPRIATRQ